MNLEPFKNRYASIVEDFVRSSRERHLAEAAQLGRELVEANVPPEDIGEIHWGAVTRLAEQSADKAAIETAQRACACLLEMLMAYGLAFRSLLDRQEKARQALQDSNARLQAVLDASEEIIFTKDLEGRYCLANAAFSKMFARPISQIIGKTDHELFTKEEAEGLQAIDQEVFRSGTARRDENILRVKGNRHIFHTTKVPLFDSTGKVIGLCGFAEDITKLKQTRQALKRTAEQAQRYLDIAAVMIVALDRAGRVTLINKKGCEILGRPEREIIGRDWFDGFIAAAERDSTRRVFGELMAGWVENVEVFENHVVTADGRQRLISWHNALVRNRHGRVVGTLSSGLDITERRHAEQERESLAKFPEEDPNPVLRIAGDGKVLYCNPAGLRLLSNWKCDAGSHVPRYWHDHVSAALGEKQTRQVETELDGCVYSLTICPVPEQDYVNIYAMDVTDRKLAELKLVRQQNHLKKLASQLTLAEERQKRRIAADLHDNVGQSLAFAKLRLETLRKSRSPCGDDEVLEEISDLLGRTIRQVKSLIFDLSSPELYTMGFAAAVTQWLEDNVQGKFGIKAIFSDDGKPKPLAEDVQVLLFRNVIELLTNVIKHARASEVRVSLARDDTRMVVRIEDNGIGFDVAEVNAHGAGRGEFGLFSIRERLSELGGSIEINSLPGRGCTVIMTAPIQEKTEREDHENGGHSTVGGRPRHHQAGHPPAS